MRREVLLLTRIFIQESVSKSVFILKTWNGRRGLKPLVYAALSLKPLVYAALSLKPLVYAALTWNGRRGLRPLVYVALSY